MGGIGEGKVGEIGEGRRKRFHLHLPSRVVGLVPGELQLIALPLEAPVTVNIMKSIGLAKSKHKQTQTQMKKYKQRQKQT